VVKDKHEDISSSDNYRGITIGPVISKVFEVRLLDKFGSTLESNDLQLGFKKKLGCEPCVYLLQNVTDYFACKSSPVFIASLDASKAFDRINHEKLFVKLFERGAPRCFISVLEKRYSKLIFCVRWNGILGGVFRVVCGVRQRGRLSPFLFNIYVDKLLNLLSISGHGCQVGTVFYGCFMYADDLILLSPSLRSLQ